MKKVFFLFFISCNNSNKNCYCGLRVNNFINDSGIVVTKNVTSYKTDIFNVISNKFSMSLLSNVDIIENEGKSYFSFISKMGNAVFVNTEDSLNIVHNFLHNALTNKTFFFEKFIDNSLYLVDQRNNKYWCFTFDNHLKIKSIDSLNLNSIFNFRNYFLGFNANPQRFTFQFPYLFLRYGTNNSRNYFIDEFAFLKINIQTKKVEKIIKYPECFYSGNTYMNDGYIATDNENNYYALFNLHDTLMKFDAYNRTKTTSKIINPYHSTFIEFDKSKNENLAYTRKFQLLNEENTHFFMIKNKYLISIKRLKKIAIKDTNQFVYFLYNKNLKQLFSDTLSTISASYIIPNSKGFLVRDYSFKTGTYYEFDEK